MPGQKQVTRCRVPNDIDDGDGTDMLSDVVFGVGVSACLVVAGLSIATSLKENFQFWPPPTPHSWQHRIFRALFRVFFFAVVILSFIDFDSGRDRWHIAVGIVLFVAGFGLTLRWTGYLGWRDAFGEAKALKTEGPFAWSRNPIYVVSIVGMLGWGIIVCSTYVTILLCLWALAYLGAPFLEEPWLEQQYGEEYRTYKKRVPRFFRFFG